MALLIITGTSGSGKSKYVCDWVLQESEKHPKKNYFVIVPDQFTMQTQMDFVQASKKGGIMNIDVLSFSRLAHRIFEETGGNRQPVLDDTGKSLVLRKIAGSMKEKVPLIGANLNKQGYVHEVKSAISEFMQYGIGQTQLTEMIEFSKPRGALYYKLKDLQVLYQAFKEYIKDHYITTEESMDILAKELYKSQLISDSVVVFDGFTGFTPIQEKVIGALLKLCEQVAITITMDGNALTAGEESLFSFAAETLHRLIRVANEQDVEVLPMIEMKKNWRFAKNQPLAHLEKHLFRYPLTPYPKTGAENDRIQISAHKDMQQEIRFLCQRIRKLIQKTGCAYRDIAVIAGDLASYESEIEEEFTQYEIPFFMDKTRNILLNPVIEYIKAAISILTQDFSYESVFHYLRSGLAEFTQEEIDDLENYILELGIRGRRMWSHRFVGRTRRMKQLDQQAELQKAEELSDPSIHPEDTEGKIITSIQLLEYLNELRERLLEQLSALFADTEAKECTGKTAAAEAANAKEDKKTELGKGTEEIQVQDMVMRLYRFLTWNRIEQKLHSYASFFEVQKEDARAKEYQQIYRLLMELLEQIIELIGQETMPLKEFADILEAGFAEIEVGIIPRSVDRVIVGDIERTRLKPVKYLFFVGVNDGYIPAKANKGGIISDIDREFLQGSKQKLAPSPREKMYIQKYYLYLNMTKPSEGLYLSYCAVDSQGAAIRPSYLIGVMKKLFCDCEIVLHEDHGLSIGNTEEAKEEFCRLLAAYAEGRIMKTEREQFLQLLYLLDQKETSQWLLEHWIKNAFMEREDRRIKQTTAGVLYGDMILSSISRMERYASCAYSYFLQYGLSLKERELYGFAPKDMGTIFHGVLEHFSAKLQEGNYTWMNFPEEEGRAMVSASMEEVCMDYTDALLYDSALHQYTMKKMERVLQKCVTNISDQLKKGFFVPKEYEVSFQMIESLQDLDMSLNKEDKMRLVGRIDRLDTCEKEDKVLVKIVDYKSCDKNFDLAAFYHGTQLQLVVYMNEAKKRAEKLHPGKRAVGAAMLYYHVDDPIVEGDSKMTPERINAKIKEALRMKGIINADGEVLEALDHSKSAKSDCVAVDYDSKGNLKAYVNAYTEEQLQLLSDYASYSLKKMGVRIKKGEIPLNPYVSGSMDACTYCAYKDVCGFDEKLPGCKKRNLDKEKEMDYLEAMKTEMRK